LLSIRGIEHHIDLVPGLAIPNRLAYISNHEEIKEFQMQVEELILKGYIWESMSLLLVKYRYPIPILDDMLDELHEFCLFSKINLKTCYHHIRIK